MESGERKGEKGFKNPLGGKINESKIGDRVKIVETRPLSKDKHWRVAGVIERGEKSQQA